jgi:nucleoside-diphosphate-sugar epimerase
MNWGATTALVTGGASFIGSHLAEALVKKGARVRVADNLSSGRLFNLQGMWSDIEFMKGDLKHWDFAMKSCKGCDVVFHLAAAHGGRGYIAAHPADCATNMALDNIVFETAVKSEVERITYASSACVYPTDIQEDKVLLRENLVSFDERGGAFADEEYGWAKLMGELSLRAFHEQYGISASSVRIHTAYGPRENETHAIIALIAKAFIRQTPFEIWGDGEQTRNFTYVDDVVRALVLACENIDDGSAVNAGTSESISINEAAEVVFDIIGWRPPSDGIKHLVDKPVGIRHRAADTALARSMMGWEPKYSFVDGLQATIEWYVQHHNPAEVRSDLESLLLER